MMATVQEISISFHYASTLATSKAEFPVIVRALEYLQTNCEGKTVVDLSALLRI
jgi:hypothetical protein